MALGSIVISSPRKNLSLQQLLDVAKAYLDHARNAEDPAIALVFCYDAELSISQAKKAAKHTDDKSVREGIASLYIGLGDLLESRGHQAEAQTYYKKSEKWGGRVHESAQPTHPSDSVGSVGGTSHPTLETSIVKTATALSPRKQVDDMATVPQNIFPRNVRIHIAEFKPPEPDTRLTSTSQLACCLGLLQGSYEADDIQDQVAYNWVELIKKEPDERERLETLAMDVIRAFSRDELKDGKAVSEVVILGPVLDKDDLRCLVKELLSGISQSKMLDIHQLEGLAQLIQSADSKYLDPDDLVKILELLSERLRDTHQQSNNLYQLTLAVSHVLDAMADAEVTGLDRVGLHEPLSSYLDNLKSSPDTYLVYQAAYAFQALQCIPDNESLWKATSRRTGKVIKGVLGLVSAVKGLDLIAFLEGLGNIQQGLAGASDVVRIVKTTYDGVTSLASGGKGFMDCLKESLSFSRRCAWYPALRGADTLIQDGQFAEFRKLVCEAPCRHDPAFQWGVCQRLGEVAANPSWDSETRQGAIAFLGEIYGNDEVWGRQTNVKQWILNILLQLSSRSGREMQFAESLFQELRQNGDAKKQALYRACLEKDSGPHPLKVPLPEPRNPSLLDRVQERPDVEGHLRQIRRQRLKERGNTVYIPPQAKASLQARDDILFPLMEKVDDFLTGDQKVFLLLGDSGAGKSTFNRELECSLWDTYKKNVGPIPLHISLPSIEKPEHDMIAKQLRKAEFTEPQIRELKLNRKFILICDGYDESQQTHNLYMSNRLNMTGEWNAKLVISCRSEYVGVDYRDRFQPGDRNQRPEPGQFQEAVMAPFELNQVENYIDQYVTLHRPLWEAKEYKEALNLIPSLKELVKNPFLMSLSLEVLPRMVDRGQDLSATRVTRVALYDHFIEHWLERGKKRLGEKNMSPQARAAFESLSDEGFTPNGIDFLKKLSVEIYKRQNGQPIVRYSRYKDEGSWKAAFFSREDEKQLLREACPLTRSGNQHRFIHRSLLEYGISLAVFDPQDWKERLMQASSSTVARRSSVDSDMSFLIKDTSEEEVTTIGREPDPKSPLAWRSFVNEPSVLEFLSERAQHEPLFKQQLLDYIEHSRIMDKTWRMAAANSITILIRAGVQFNGADLRGIQIPMADLSHGMFDSAQLQGADLRHANLRGVWLKNANLSEANMAGVQFGELPYLKEGDQIETCAYSPDETTIVVAAYSGNIYMYSKSTCEKLHTLEGHSDCVRKIAFSPKGNRLVTGSRDTMVRLWDVTSGECLHILHGHEKEVRGVSYSPQGHQVASASEDQTVRLWDSESGDCLFTLTGHTNSVYGITYSPNDNSIASYGPDSTIRLWSIETGECLHVLRHDEIVHSIDYSPDGKQLASTGDDRSVRLWDAATGESQHILMGHKGQIFFVKYSPKGDQVASACSDRTVRLWNVESGECLHTLTDHTNSIRRIAYSPKGDLMATASADKTVRLWDPETGLCLQTLTGHSDGVSQVTFSPNGDQIASRGDDTIRLWDIVPGTSQLLSIGHSREVLRVKDSPRGNQIASCSHDTTARLWDIESGACLHTLRGHVDSVQCVVYSPQGDQIATGSQDNTARLWDVETGACIHELKAHTSGVYSVAYSPQGDKLASASGDASVRLWDVTSGECLFKLTGHTDRVFCVAYSPNGNLVASCSLEICIWDDKTGACVNTLTGHEEEIANIAFSPRGDQLASASDDGTVRLWDVATGECRHILTGHTHMVYHVVYSPNGSQLASAGVDGTVRLWDPATGQSQHTMTGHFRDIGSIVFSSQGDLVASAGYDKSVRLWDVAAGKCCAAIQDFKDVIENVAWIEVADVQYLVAGSNGGVVGLWKVTNDGEERRLTLRWWTSKGELNMKDANIKGVRGLSPLNKQLLRQREAVGEPIHHLKEASRKLISMGSAVAKLKASPDGVEEDLELTSSSLVTEHA
ncbi:hypothetical protein BGX31_006405 [Mortierella sp. GBA43]|nr:hypothetical protein BGX31_006405 [Mortierella sp. GBA43]